MIAVLMAMRERRWGQGRLRRVALLLPLAMFFVPLASQAQTRTVEFQHADFLEVTSDSLGEVQRAEGNVRMRQDTTAMRARQATYYVTLGQVVFSGAVRIISGQDTLTSDVVEYNSNDKTSVARGSVRLGDGESVVRAPEMTYDSRAEFATFVGDGEIRNQGAVLTSASGTYSSARRYATFPDPVRLVDSTGVITADRGTYDGRIRRVDFAGSVLLRRPAEHLDADSLVYFRRTERARAFGQTILQQIGEAEDGQAPADSSRRTLLFSETLQFDGQAETASARGLPAGPDGPALDPLLVVLQGRDDGGVDSTLTRATRIDVARTITEADTTTVLTAAGAVRLWERRLSARADSVHLLRQGGVDTIRLFGQRPSVWADGAQMTGDSLQVIVRDGAVESLRVWGRAFVGRVDSTLGRLNQIAGGQLFARFDGDELTRLDVWPNAELLQYTATADGLLDGAIQTAQDSLSFRFADGDLRSINGDTNISGTVFGGSNVPNGLRLPGFAFAIGGAPTRQSVLEDAWEAGWLERFSPPASALRPPGSPSGSASRVPEAEEAGEDPTSLDS